MDKGFEEKCIKSTKIYDGKVISLRVDDVELSDGTKSKREEVSHRAGSSILVINDGKILMVKQFRYAYNEVIYEIPAGKLETDEDPIETAKRELLEETGYKAKNMKLLTCAYPSPGYTNEKLYLFIADGLVKGENHFDFDEYLTTEWIEEEKVYEMIKNGMIKDAKTIISILWYRSFIK